jgi:hypothetical protein
MILTNAEPISDAAAERRSRPSARALASLSRPVLPGERSPDQRLLDEAVADLNRIYTAKALETARLIGGYILERFFAGSAERFHDRGRKHVSFRLLAERPDLKFSYSYLWTCVAVVEQYAELPHDIADALPLSHHRLLLPVRDRDEKVALARRAVVEGLSKRQLADVIRPRRCPRAIHARFMDRGEHPMARALAQIRGALRAALSSPGLDDFGDLPSGDAKLIVDELERESEKLAQLLRTLRSRKPVRR